LSEIICVVYYIGVRGGGHNGHRGTKSRSNCERTCWLRVVTFL